MAFGPKNVESACRKNFLLVLLAIGPNLFEDLQLVRFRQVFFPVQDLLEHEVGIAAQENVGAAARHVRRDGDGALVASLGDDLSFPLVLLRIEDVVLHAGPAQVAGKPLRFFDGNRADQDWLASLVAFLDVFDDRGKLFFLGPVDDICIIQADHVAIGRNHIDVEIIDLGELRRFRVRRAGHAAELLVHPEIVLEGDRGQRLILVRNLHAFFSFDGLVQAVAPAAARHEAPGEFVHDDDFALFHDIIHVPLVEAIGLEPLDDVMDEVHMVGIVEIVHAEQFLDSDVAVLGQRRGLRLFLDRVVLLRFQLRDNRVDAVIEIGRFIRRTGDNQGRAGFVDEDTVDFVHDGEVQLALHALGQIGDNQVVAQVVKAIFIVRPVGDVGAIGFGPRAGAERLEPLVGGLIGRIEEKGGIVLNDADRKSQRVVEHAHPLRIALGKVVVHRDEVHALPFERIQIDR
ncbi:MAG: hypothetical protein JW395_2337 [Nitrospira sp.]|nr:hypothetical protein [Nitrospira sp.]